MNEDELFQELANDPELAAAAAEHAAACSVTAKGCIICEFFSAVHFLSQTSDVFAEDKLVELSGWSAEFASDCLKVSRFLTAIGQYFIENIDLDENDEDFDDEDDEPEDDE